jgi:hypothetical protein
MKIYKVGPDELDGFEDCVWVVYWYEGGSYDGSGEAIYLKEDGQLYSENLGHCSCYGPLDGGPEFMCSVDDLLNGINDVHGYITDPQIQRKVLELLGKS